MHRNARGEQDVASVDAFRVCADAAFLHDEVHDVAHVDGRRHDAGVDERLFNAVDLRGIRQMHGIVHVYHGAVVEINVVDHARIGGDDVHVVFASEPLLDDFHVQEAEESAAEAEAERGGSFRLIGERRVVELEFRHAEFQLFVIRRVDGINAAEDHRPDFLEAGEGFGTGILHLRDRVSDPGVGGAFDVRDQIAHGTGGETVDGLHFRGEYARLLDFAFQSGAEEPQLVSAPETAVVDAHIGDDAAVGVVNRVEDQSVCGSVLGSFRRGNEFHDRLQHGGNAGAVLGGHGDRLLARNRQNLLQLIMTHAQIRRGKVDLVDDGNDLEVVLEREIHIRDSLRLDALGRVDDEDRPLACRKGAADLVGEVHMTGGVDEIEFVFLSVVRLVEHAHGMGLDRDAAFLFEIHGVEKLGVDQIARLNGVSRLKQAVRQRGFPVVDVRDDRKVPYPVQICHV